MSFTIPYHVHHNHTPERSVTVQATPEQVQMLVNEGYLVLERLFQGEALEKLRAATLEVAEREGHVARSGRE